MERKEQHLRNLAAENRERLARSEKYHISEINALKQQIKNATKEIDNLSKNLKSKEMDHKSQLTILKTRNKNEIRELEKEIRNMELKYLTDISERLDQMDIAKQKRESDRQNVSEAMKDEEAARELSNRLSELNEFWWFVMDEFDTLWFFEKMDSDEQEGLADEFRACLDGMEARKAEMDQFVWSLIKDSRLAKMNGGAEVVGILKLIRKPLISMLKLVELGNSGEIGEITDLQKELKEVSNLIHQLDKIHVTPKKTVSRMLDSQQTSSIAN